MQAIERGTLLWTPPADALDRCALGRYLRWLERETGRTFPDYDALWRWSIDELETFWEGLARFFALRMTPARRVLSGRGMPGARWFEGATLNYAEQALRRSGPGPALIFRREDGSGGTLSWDALRDAVARARAGLARLGVGEGDRVAAYLPNGPEAVIAFLAAASLGATWSSCSPEFGVQSVLDRLSQIAPKVLLSVDGYHHGGKSFDRREATAAIAAALPSLRAVVEVPRLGLPPVALRVARCSFAELCAEPGELAFAPCAFEHPLWILYSSGTTGLPKAIVQGHGGILLEHLKALSLHGDLGPDSVFFWFTTTGWMMWNFLVSGLTVGATIALYEGDPAHPDPLALFRYAADARFTYFGTSAPYLSHCEKRGLTPSAEVDLGALRTLGVTGAPLAVSGFAWVYQHVKRDLQLASISGGTDVCTAFLLAAPVLPVYAGELSCRGLGAAVAAFDPAGSPLVGAVGELVITAPMPSMPLYFLDDPAGERLRESYFAAYPGVWRHGDFVEITPRGTSVIYGRSDATLNRGGIRMGTAEIYRIVEALPEVLESLVVDTGALDREDALWLFVVLSEGHALTPALRDQLAQTLRRELSPRHVPDHVVAVAALPRTLNGKKLEVPIKRIMMGTPRTRAIAPGTLQNPEAVDALLNAVASITGERGGGPHPEADS